MYEIPFVFEDVERCGIAESIAKSSARFAALSDVAAKLVKAGCYVEWTITGLAFATPLKHPESHTFAQARTFLDGLGIPMPFRKQCSRSVVDILTAKVECEDRSWYAEAEKNIRSTVEDECLNWEDRQYLCETIAKLVEKENIYPRKELVVVDDYQRGILQGRQQALRWLFGAEWPAFEEDEWEAEDNRYAIDEINRKRALDGMQELLFKGQDQQAIVEDAPALEQQPSGATPPATAAMTQPATAAMTQPATAAMTEALARLTKARAARTNEEEPIGLS